MLGNFQCSYSGSSKVATLELITWHMPISVIADSTPIGMLLFVVSETFVNTLNTIAAMDA